MAIFHHSTQIIGRSSGRSAVGAAAYRLGAEMVDERTGQRFDYTHKKGVEPGVILAPDNAPEWCQDPAQLWNRVEQGEKRKDAQLCREINIALPSELNHKEKRALMLDYCRDEFTAKGMIAMVAFHDLDSHNPHAHIMLTMREIGPDGFGNKMREWNNHDLATEYRQHWAERANRALELAGHDARIDHRSLEDQGIDRTPTQHQGPVVGEMVKRGMAVERTRIQPVPPSMDHAKALADRQREEQERVWRGEKQEQAARAQADLDAKWAGLAKANETVERRRSAKEQAEHEHKQKQTRHGKTVDSRERRAERVEQWITKHPWRYRLHESGWWPSRELTGMAAKWLRQDQRANRQEERLGKSAQEVRRAGQWLDQAQQDARGWEEARQQAETRRNNATARVREIEAGRWTMEQDQEQARKEQERRQGMTMPKRSVGGDVELPLTRYERGAGMPKRRDWTTEPPRLTPGRGRGRSMSR